MVYKTVALLLSKAVNILKCNDDNNTVLFNVVKQLTFKYEKNVDLKLKNHLQK